jgi:hypothetical protein
MVGNSHALVTLADPGKPCEDTNPGRSVRGRCAAAPRLLSMDTVPKGSSHKVGFAPGGKVMEARTRNNASDTPQALGACADDRPGQGRPVVSGYHWRERR